MAKNVCTFFFSDVGWSQIKLITDLYWNNIYSHRNGIKNYNISKVSINEF